MNTQRRHLLSLPLALALPLAAPAWAQAQKKTALPPVQVWKDPNCGCCQDWIDHMKAAGFSVQTHDSGNAAVRRRLGLAERYGSCHTALVGGYVVEGHVPAREVRRLLAEKPAALGLAVPGMPVGSPGMDGPVYGGRQDPHDVLLVRRDGSSEAYQSYFRQTAGPASAEQKPGAQAADTRPFTEGEVRRVNASTQQVTLRHGEIRNLDMPPMTMAFTLRNAALLQGLKVGDRVRFTAERIDGVYTVMSLEPLAPR